MSPNLELTCRSFTIHQYSRSRPWWMEKRYGLPKNHTKPAATVASRCSSPIAQVTVQSIDRRMLEGVLLCPFSLSLVLLFNSFTYLA